MVTEETEFEDEKDAAVAPESAANFSDAVLFSSDWTIETVLSQLSKGNIQLNPNFQRREAWSNARKSRFIESIIIGLPIPQLVLAEAKGQRGKFIVLDGKQRLLSLLRFTESEESREKGFSLSGLEILQGLARKKYYHLLREADLEGARDQFHNYTLRTVVIRAWPNTDFLHQVFLRLNTGSVTLSAQELRQAMAPGDFTTFADEYSADSKPIQGLLGRDTADPRMRDVELLVRHIAFQRHLEKYKGRLKSFLDDVCVHENKNWGTDKEKIQKSACEFVSAIVVLTEIFGDQLARKPESRSFNRAIFDCLSYYSADQTVRTAMQMNSQKVLAAYASTVALPQFLLAVESDTAGLPNTAARLNIWGEALQEALGIMLRIPSYDEANRAIKV